MYDIYEKKGRDSFGGNWTETLVVKGNRILAHTRAWDNPQVVEKFDDWLKGKPLSERGRGWRKLTERHARIHQTWASEFVDYTETGMV